MRGGRLNCYGTLTVIFLPLAQQKILIWVM